VKETFTIAGLTPTIYWERAQEYPNVIHGIFKTASTDHLYRV
jgi:hypothetical protein